MTAALAFRGQCGIDTTAIPTRRFKLISESLGESQDILDTTGLPGTRAHNVENTRTNLRHVGGTITMEPTALELAFLLPWMLGGAATAAGGNLAAPGTFAAALASGGTLTLATPYFYTITSFNPVGETTGSLEVTATPSGGNRSITLTWVPVSGAAGYRIYRTLSTGTYGATSLLITLDLQATATYTDTNAVSLKTGTVPVSNTAASGTITFPLAETIPSRFVTLDKIQDVYTSECGVDSWSLRGSQGQPLSLSLNLVGKDHTAGGASTFPVLNQDFTTKPYIFTDLILTVNSTPYSCRDFTITGNNFVDRNRFFNSTTLTALNAMDRAFSISTTLPWGDASALYGAAAGGLSMSAVFTDGGSILTFSSSILQFPKQTPTMPNRSEIMYPIRAILKRTGSTAELTCTQATGP